jgi:hypothetical protein
MCLIFVAREGVPTLSALERAESGNSDGAGIAWVQKGEDKKENVVHWEKNLKAKEIFKLFSDMKLERHLPNYPFIIHFRSASSGGVNPNLCQPFSLEKKVSTELIGEAKAVLFHNGTYHNYDDMMKQVCWAGGAEIPLGPWNDSRALAWLAVNRGLGSLALTHHGGYSGGNGGRIAILRNTGQLHLFGNGWIKGEQEGVTQSGSLASEKSFCHVGKDYKVYEGPSTKYIKRPLKCSLYEESDKVILYSIQEHEGILKEIEEEQRAFSLLSH